MPDWSTIGASVNASMQDAFGEPVVYQSVQSGFPFGDPFTVTAIRRIRVKEEAGGRASVEEISVNPARFRETLPSPAIGLPPGDRNSW